MSFDCNTNIVEYSTHVKTFLFHLIRRICNLLIYWRKYNRLTITLHIVYKTKFRKLLDT